ncbi:4-hydroxybenzoate octaprenyltransferase [Phenylobacterium sp.]|uniref:4-hydroxybenzoate octaprenyltransferase n=1 Tax=Phenylobacterium sp. TaxID=1871053 RepID=UPI0025FCF876|nr:4-hydroxybenzoate octaprenyltransferase [Phenylobacterium sp.]MBX3485175.1 4-hydroxybenzoate octaprenyltransferase [Phenylobacterium sp.]
MTSAAPLPDAAPTNWVDRHAPAPLRPWLKLGRFDRPTGIWLLMLPGWQGVALAAAEQGRLPNLQLLVLFFLGAALMRAAGCAYNDIVDRDLDAKVARTAGRPIASGQIGVKAAWGYVIGCSLVSLLILVCLSPLAIALGVGSLALVAIYPFMKRITWWPQAWLGLTFNWGALMGYAAATGTSALAAAWQYQTQDFFYLDTGRLTYAAGFLYLSGIFWTLGYDTIYAIQDLEDDALAGVKSSARRLGDKAQRAVAGFYLVTVAAAFVAGAAGGLGLPYDLALFAFAIHLGLQARRVKTTDPALALRLFRSNTWAGAILFLALALGAFR